MPNLDELYRRHGPGLWRFVLHRARQPADAQEIFQEIFVIAAQKKSQLAAAASQFVWLLAVARNLLRNYYRSRARHAAVPLPTDLSAAKPDADDRPDDVTRAIARLPAPQREVLELKLADELSYAQIAAALDIPIGTVRSRIHNAVVALRSALCPGKPAPCDPSITVRNS